MNYFYNKFVCWQLERIFSLFNAISIMGLTHYKENLMITYTSIRKLQSSELQFAVE